jgi:hypothetical protein
MRLPPLPIAHPPKKRKSILTGSAVQGRRHARRLRSPTTRRTGSHRWRRCHRLHPYRTRRLGLIRVPLAKAFGVFWAFRNELLNALVRCRGQRLGGADPRLSFGCRTNDHHQRPTGAVGSNLDRAGTADRPGIVVVMTARDCRRTPVKRGVIGLNRSVSVDICSLFVPVMHGEVKCLTAAEKGRTQGLSSNGGGRFDEDWISSFVQRTGEQS